MNSRRFLPLLALCSAVLLTACGGGDDGVTLGPFDNITVTEGEAPRAIKPPTSKSPAIFVITSSNPQVATVSEDYMLTIIAPGQATLIASQPEKGSFNPTRTTAVLTVKERVCTAPEVKKNGICVAPLTGS